MTESTIDIDRSTTAAPETPDPADAPPPVPAAPPDDENPAIRDARRAFVITLVGAALFVGSVFVFIL